MAESDDEEMLWPYLEVTMGDDPGDLGVDEPQVQPLCRACTRDLPDDDGGLCAFCKVVVQP